MNLWQWLLIPTPDGATYFQAIIIISALVLITKFFLIPMVKDLNEICISLDDGKEE